MPGASGEGDSGGEDVQGRVSVEEAVVAINQHLAATRRHWAPITASTRFEDLELDSFDVAGIVLTLEERIGVRLTVGSIGDVEVVGDLASMVEAP